MNIKTIKEKYTCLDYLGERVVRKTVDGYLCRAPWREDKHPSLTVTANGRGWKDHVTGKHGSIIDMVMECLGTTDLKRVCAEFDNTTLSPFDQSKIFGESKEERAGFAQFAIVPLQSRGLYAYLTHRGINITIAKQFLKEAHYSFRQCTDGRYLYALAYGNDLGGYELRSERFKGGSSPKGITSHWNFDDAPMVVFEGFMDMLSFATLCGGVKHNYIVLNSIVNADASIDALRGCPGTIYLCLDNDEGGETTTRKLLDALPFAIDIRSRFAPAKDVNEYLMKHK